MTDIDPRRARSGSLLLVALLAFTLLGAAGVGTVAADETVDLRCAGTGGGAAYLTDSNLTVYENASNVTHGNFTDNETVDFGNVSLSASDNASARLENATGNVTCLSDVNATNATITITANGEGTFHLDGNATGLSVRGPVYATGDGGVDFAYNSSGGEGLTVRINETGLASDETVAAVDAETGAELARSGVAANGSLALSLPAGTHPVDVRRVVNTGDDDDDDDDAPDSTPPPADPLPGIDAEPDVRAETAITDAAPGQPGTTVEFTGTNVVERLTFEGGAEGSVTVAAFDAPPEAVSEEVTAAVDGADEVVSVVDISPTDDGDEPSGATITLAVDPDELVRPQDAVIAHETGEGWETLNTSVASASGDQVALRASVESFSLFAVVQTGPHGQTATTAPVTATTPPSTQVIATTAAPGGTQEPTPTETPTATGTPGFGAVVAVIAVSAAAVLGKRRE